MLAGLSGPHGPPIASLAVQTTNWTPAGSHQRPCLANPHLLRPEVVHWQLLGRLRGYHPPPHRV